MNTLSIVADFACPWCYIGKVRLEHALKKIDFARKLRVRFLPFLLNPGLPPEGMPRPAYRVQKFGSLERSNQLDAEVRAAAAETGILINHDRMERTPNTLMAHMLMAMAANVPTKAKDTAAALADQLFRAYFTEGVDIGDPDELVRIAESVGVPRDISVSALGDKELKTATSSLASGLAEQGITGVPTLLMNQHFFISGAVPSADLMRMIPQAIAIFENQ